MRAWAHRTAKTVMLTAAFTAAGSGLPSVGWPGTAFAASAGAGGSTSGLGSVLGGHQASAPISAPVDVCGSAVVVLGLGPDGCQGGASVAGTSAGSAGGSMSPATLGNGSAGGNQMRASACRSASAATRSATPWLAAGAGRRCPVHTTARARPPRAAARWAAATRPPRRSASPPMCAGTRRPCSAIRWPAARGPHRFAGSGSLPVGGPAGEEFNGAGTQLGAGGAGAGSLPPGLGGLPVASALSGLPQPASSSLADLAGPAAASAPVAGGTEDGQPIPANALAADSASGMGSVSFYFLAIGALLAGAVALKMAGRRIRGHRIRGHKA